MHYLQILADPMMSSEAELEVIRQVGAAVVSIVSAIGIVAVAILNRTRQHTKQTRDNAESAATNAATAAINSEVIKAEVKNSHDTNLREESDERHKVLMSTLELVVRTQQLQGKSIHSVQRDVGGLRGDVRELRSNLEAERERIRDLEDTHPHAKKPTRHASRKDPS